MSIDQYTKDILRPLCEPPGYVVSIWPLIRMKNGTSLLEAYNNFSVALEPYLPNDCELYPPSCLHITIATLISFVATSTSNNKIDEKILKDILNQAKKDPSWPCLKEELTITIKEPTLNKDGTVGFFFNECKEIKYIRDCLKRAVIDTPIEFQMKCPGIVHSTFLRFTRESNVTKKFRHEFEEIAKQMKPITITCHTIEIIKESKPYMHMSLPSQRHIVHQVSVSSNSSNGGDGDGDGDVDGSSSSSISSSSSSSSNSNVTKDDQKEKKNSTTTNTNVTTCNLIQPILFLLFLLSLTFIIVYSITQILLGTNGRKAFHPIKWLYADDKSEFDNTWYTWGT
jgi:hypothetical protein